MEAMIAMVLVTIGLMFLNVQYTKTTQPKQQADFEDHKKQYIEQENREEVEMVEETAIAQNSPNSNLPLHLQDKVVEVEIRGKWYNVVDVKFLEIKN